MFQLKVFFVYRGKPFYCTFGDCNRVEFCLLNEFTRHFRRNHREYYAEGYESSEGDEVLLPDNMMFKEDEMHCPSLNDQLDYEMMHDFSNDEDETTYNNYSHFNGMDDDDDDDDLFDFKSELQEKFLNNKLSPNCDFETTKK